MGIFTISIFPTLERSGVGIFTISIFPTLERSRVGILRKLLMDCICTQKCTVRVNNRSIYFEKGQIVNFEECPTHHFQSLHSTEIDFKTASLELLLNSKNWKIKDALEFLKTEYNYSPKTPKTRKEVAKQVVDKRMRKVTLPNEV